MIAPLFRQFVKENVKRQDSIIMDKKIQLIENVVNQVVNAPRPIVEQLSDDNGNRVGRYVGIVFNEDRDLNNWLNKEMVDNDVRTALDRASTFLYPLGILETIKIDKKHRGQGYGNKALNEFFSKAQPCSCYLLTADLRNKQSKGFDLIEWYKNKGFCPIGKSGSNTVMLKKA